MPVFGLIGGLGPWELGIILIIVLIFFGAGKLPQVFETFGVAVKKFRDAQRDEEIDVTPRELDDHADASEVHARDRETVSNN